MSTEVQKLEAIRIALQLPRTAPYGDALGVIRRLEQQHDELLKAAIEWNKNRTTASEFALVEAITKACRFVGGR